jgi:hypothetical protein
MPLHNCTSTLLSTHLYVCVRAYACAAGLQVKAILMYTHTQSVQVVKMVNEVYRFECAAVWCCEQLFVLRGKVIG